MFRPQDARVTAKILLISVEEAIRLRKTCHFPNQRNIRDLNVLRLGLEMEKFRFIQGTVIFMVVLPDGQQYIVNGNHTLEAIAYSGKEQLLTFVFLEIDTFEEAKQVYMSFDVHKARTWADALRASGKDLTQPMSKQVTAAAKLLMSGFRYAPENVEANSSRISRFDFSDAYNDSAALLQEAMKEAPALNQRLVMRAAVMAVALETVRYEPEPAVRFWGAMVHDNGLVKGDPRKTLLQYLLTHKAGKGAEGYLQSRAAAHCWNAWMDGKQVINLRITIAGKMEIRGTPWDGSKGPDGDAVEPRTRAKPRPRQEGPSNLSGAFKTGTRYTRDGEEPVDLYRPEA